MAERTKFKSYFVYSLVITAFIYPTILRWTWGGGWLAQLDIPFSDFAGSTIVHATGGWAALAGALVLGPRLGKYGPDGKARAIPGHNVPFVVLGGMILFIGWFGFNPGSELGADNFVTQIAVKTLVAACAGAVVAMLVNWLKDGKPDVTMATNGMLAGLVSITAPCGAVETWAAIVIGAIGGFIVVFAVAFFDRMKVDDPVGAISVHGVCGTWGTLSIAFFAKYDDAFLGREDAGMFYGGGIDQLSTQALFIGTHFVFVFGCALLLFTAIKKTIGLRTSEEEEINGLDIEEHGHMGYAARLQRRRADRPRGLVQQDHHGLIDRDDIKGEPRVASRHGGHQAAQARGREGGPEGGRRPGHHRLGGQGVRSPGRPHRDLPRRRVHHRLRPQGEDRGGVRNRRGREGRRGHRRLSPDRQDR